jgi:hypothetical protein
MDQSTREGRVTEGYVEEINEEGPHSFAHQIALMCDGETNAEASEEMHDLLKRLRAEASARRKKVKGTLKLELTLEVDDNDVVGLSYSIKCKAPEPRRQTQVLWLSKGGNLSPENPRQQKLPLREVGGRDEPAREVRDTGTTREV